MKDEKLKAKEKRKNIHTNLNVGFQRITGEMKKPSSVINAKKIEENTRMGKIKDLFKKIRDIKEIFHAKMDTIKDRNGINLIETEDIKKMWQEYTELYKKYLHDPDNHDVMITYLEPDILQGKVKGPQEAPLQTS